jgi:hypothetical protein
LLLFFATAAIGQIVLPRPSEPPSAPPPAPAAPGTVSPGPAVGPTFRLRVCNTSALSAAVAVNARLDPDNPNDWTLAGWWVLEPQQCANLVDALWGWFYLYAEEKGRGGGGTVWPGLSQKRDDDLTFCVEYPGPFQRLRRGASVTCDESLLKLFWASDQRPAAGDLRIVTLRSQ